MCGCISRRWHTQFWIFPVKGGWYGDRHQVLIKATSVTCDLPVHKVIARRVTCTRINAACCAACNANLPLETSTAQVCFDREQQQRGKYFSYIPVCFSEFWHHSRSLQSKLITVTFVVLTKLHRLKGTRLSETVPVLPLPTCSRAHSVVTRCRQLLMQFGHHLNEALRCNYPPDISN